MEIERLPAGRSVGRALERTCPPPVEEASDPFLYLQRTVGNRALTLLVPALRPAVFKARMPQLGAGAVVKPSVSHSISAVAASAAQARSFSSFGVNSLMNLIFLQSPTREKASAAPTSNPQRLTEEQLKELLKEHRGQLLTHATDKVRPTIEAPEDPARKTNPGTDNVKVHFWPGLNTQYSHHPIVWIFLKKDVGGGPQSGDWVAAGPIATSLARGWTSGSELANFNKKKGGF